MLKHLKASSFSSLPVYELPSFYKTFRKIPSSFFLSLKLSTPITSYVCSSRVLVKLSPLALFGCTVTLLMFISGPSSISFRGFFGLDFAFFFLLGGSDVLFNGESHSVTENEYALVGFSCYPLSSSFLYFGLTFHTPVIVLKISGWSLSSNTGLWGGYIISYALL